MRAEEFEMKSCSRQLYSRGSITVYAALMMCALVPLFFAAILSVKVKAGRMQAANSVDQSLFSLMAHYDRQLVRDFDLFFLNAGSGGSDPDIGSCIRQMEDAMDYILKPNKGLILLGGKNLLKLERESGAVTAYTLATDAGGIPFEAQAVQAMKESALLDGISHLRDKLTRREQVEQAGREYVHSDIMGNYQTVANASKEAEEERRRQEEEAAERGEELPAEETEVVVPEGFVNPIPALFRLYRRKVMDLVVPDPGNISPKAVDGESLVSKRTLAKGFGIIDATGSAAGMDNMCYIAWIIGHFGSYASPKEQCGLSYQLEYLLKGKLKDRDNLSAVVGDLMKVRQAVNMLFLFTDPEKSSELTSLGAIIATVMMVPVLEPIVKTILAALWGYVESLVDVRALLEGKKVAIVKNRESWQTDVEDLAASGGSLANLTKDIPGGLDYAEYLGTFILVAKRGTLTPRAMDLVESTMRCKGREDFRLDACIASLSVEMNIRSEGRVTFPVEASISYLDL